MWLYLFLAAAIVLALTISLAPKVPDFKEGRWEITTTTKLPGESMQTSMKQEQILTRQAYVPTIAISGYTCTTRVEWWAVGNFVPVDIYGKGEKDAVQGEGFIRFKGNRLKANLDMRMLGSKPMKKFKAQISGIYVGEK
jgi:hypothetical protein